MDKNLEKKYKKWHKDTNIEWKLAVIEKVKKENNLYLDFSFDINWLYDDCIDHLTDKRPTKIKNLAKKLGFKEIPCLHCRNIIKYWNCNEDVKWTPDNAHLFTNCE